MLIYKRIKDSSHYKDSPSKVGYGHPQYQVVDQTFGMLIPLNGRITLVNSVMAFWELVAWVRYKVEWKVGKPHKLKVEIYGKPIEQRKNPGCLGYVGDYTTQLYGDFNKPIFDRNILLFPKNSGVSPQHGWWKSWNTLFFNGWFGETHYFWKHSYGKPMELVISSPPGWWDFFLGGL